MKRLIFSWMWKSAGQEVSDWERTRRAEMTSAARGKVTPLAGKFLRLLARMTRARHVLEVGTLGRFVAHVPLETALTVVRAAPPLDLLQVAIFTDDRAELLIFITPRIAK